MEIISKFGQQGLSYKKLSFVFGVMLVSGFALSHSAFAREYRSRDTREIRRGFDLGVCVGQTLATAQPAVLLFQQPSNQQLSNQSSGQVQALDQNTIAAIQSAFLLCRTQLMGGGNQPSPGGSAGGGAGNNPTPVPVPSPTPNPQGNPIPNPVPNPVPSSGSIFSPGSN